MNHFKLFLLSLVLSLSGCAAYNIDSAISKYDKIENTINLGDSKDKVVLILEPIQSEISSSYRKRSEKYQKDGVLVEIYYARTRRQADDLTTDDEFTPFVFNDNVLVAIGWSSIGGPKTQGQAKSDVWVSQSQSFIVW